MRLTILTRGLWQYLNQHIYDQKSIWSVRRFWYLYQIKLLQKCWQQEYTVNSQQ